jgi:hypothetical protein
MSEVFYFEVPLQWSSEVKSLGTRCKVAGQDTPSETAPGVSVVTWADRVVLSCRRMCDQDDRRVAM